MSRRVGLADHFGWAIAVTVEADGSIFDRRRIELVESGLSPAPVHYDAAGLDDDSLAALIEQVRASIRTCAAAAFDALGPLATVALRTWPDDFPTDLETVRRAPWEARADAVMYRQEVAAIARERGIRVHRYDVKRVLAEATADLGAPRAALGAPWAKDHRVAYAAALAAPDGSHPGP